MKQKKYFRFVRKKKTVDFCIFVTSQQINFEFKRVLKINHTILISDWC